MITVLIVVIISLLIFSSIFSDIDDIVATTFVSVISGVLVGLMTLGAVHLTVKSTFSYNEVPIELQPVNGELVIMQNNDFVIKYDGYISVLNSSDVKVVQSDSIYATKVMTTQVRQLEKINKWTLKNQTNDTTTYFGWVNLYRNLNKNQ